MKKIALLSLVILFWSCSVSDDEEDFHLEILPIMQVQVPDQLVGGDVNRITYTYRVPTNCHNFNNVYNIESGNQRTVAVVSLVTETTPGGLECSPLTEETDERAFDFLAPNGFSTMVFKFWLGEDEFGEDIYDTYEIPVVQ